MIERPSPPPDPQPVSGTVTRSAIFLVATVRADEAAHAAVRGWCADVAAYVRSVGKRVPSGNLSCVVGFSDGAWDRLFGAPRPVELHPFREFGAGKRHAPATPGDLLLHIRADQMDLCFDLATLMLGKLGDAVTVVDEVHGFRYFDMRAMIGFVDGTENPEGQEALEFTVMGDEDPEFAGGSYVLVQKYLHDMTGWNALPIEAQERIIGRTKLSDVEFDEGVKPSWSHSALTTLEENGKEIKILRDNMPFGRPGSAEFGTYFIGYARSPAPIEQMLENMFVGRPPGNYDRLLDFSTAVTGGLFFVPSALLLEALAEREPEAVAAAGPSAIKTLLDTDTPTPANAVLDVTVSSLTNAGPDASAGSLNIGSLKGVSQA
ncbi:Dyp-type peroxidase [Pandoraea pulmonicola]|uniref:Probable deferrochelatase/peroxidase YfeX n=1 Tax=Pandoraea pulmonicola TaxID=93221 RepID=A0AAJ4Z883_PANPU|nr:Dyp-type peroxidase [Pandoraea pulmonicola]SUA88634.1 Probable deferrochelatase/peroxidase YfeX [Pandoraea pulmonicola]